MVNFDDKQKVDIVAAVFGEQLVRARYHAGDIKCGVLNGYLQADRAAILEQTGVVSERGAIELYSDIRYKKGVFQVGAARIVPARLHLQKIRDAQLYQTQSLDGAVTVYFRDGIVYAKPDAPRNVERTAQILGLEYKVV